MQGIHQGLREAEGEGCGEVREEVQEGPPQEEAWEEAAVPGDLLQARPPRLSGPWEALLIAADRPVNRPVLEARTDGVVADVPLDLKSQVTGASAQHEDGRQEKHFAADRRKLGCAHNGPARATQSVCLCAHG